MQEAYIDNKTFDQIDFTEKPLVKGEYEACTFINCDFSNADLSGFKFLTCKFSGCNLSMAKLTKTTFGDVKFKDCKMLGLGFESCNPFGLVVHFDSCILSHSSFYETKLKKTIFKSSKLEEVDFTACDLSSTIFDNCDLMNTRFDNSTLEKADFRTSFNYSIDPEINRMKKARFSQAGISGLLYKYDLEIE